MKTHRIPRPSILVMPLVAALALAGCDAADRDVGDADDADTLAAVGGADTAAAAGDALPSAQGDTVEVRLEDFRIDMPIRLTAGPTTFRVTNAGEVEHNFEVEGQGIEEEFESNLAPGATETMQVDLAAGEYTIYCPVSDHQGRGMEVTVTVGAGTGSP